MALSKRTISIPFGYGLDTKSSELRTPTGRLLSCENAVFTKAGELAKRPGYEALALSIEGGGTLSGVVGVMTHADELLAVTDAGTIYSRSEATGRWVSRGEATAVTTESHIVVRNEKEQRNPDVCVVAGLRVVVWEEWSGNPAAYDGIKYSVYDDVSGTVLVSSATVATATGTRPRVVTFGDYAVILYAVGVEVLERHLNAVTSPTTLSTAVAIIGDVVAGAAVFDACVAGDRLFVAWGSSGSGAAECMYLDTSFAVTTGPGLGGAITANACLAIAAGADQSLYILSAGAGGPDWEFFRVSYTLTIIANATAAAVTAPIRCSLVVNDGVSPAAATAVFDTAAGVRTMSLTPAGGGLGAGTLLVKGATLASHAWKYGTAGTRFAVVNWSSTEQSGYFAVNLSTARVVARIAYGNGGGARSHCTLSGAVEASEGRYAFARQQVTELVTTSTVTMTRAGVTVSDVLHEPAVRLQSARAGDGMIIAGGVPQFYDGLSVRDLGFLLYPEGVTAVAVGAGTGLMAAGVYQYCVVYEATDNLGQLHRSAPSTPVSVTAAALDSVTVTIPNLRVGTWGTAARLVVYRTAVNGSFFYRVTTSAAPTMNDPTTNTTTYTDSVADATITGNEPLYTMGGVIENVAPSASRYCVGYRGRVWLAGLEDGNTIAYSKLVRDGEPPAFCDQFVAACDPAGGPITGLGVIDDKLVIFKRDRAFALVGDGPADTGAGAVFGDPIAVTTETGCVAGASVVQTPQGLMFQSPKGIYLLDRSMQASYVGAPVEQYNALTVIGARVSSGNNRVVFWTSDGAALAYDWLMRQWSTWSNHEASCVTTWDDRHVFVRSDGVVCAETPTAFTDAGSAIKLRAVFGWIGLGGVQGYQRLLGIRVLGRFIGAHSLRCRLSYDYDPSVRGDGSIDVGALYPGSVYGGTSPYGSDAVYGGTWPTYRFEFKPERQSCQTVLVSLEDVQSTDYNEGMVLVDLGLTIGVKGYPQPLAGSRRTGVEG